MAVRDKKGQQMHCWNPEVSKWWEKRF